MILVGNPSIQQCCNVIDLFVLSFLQKLSVTVGIFQRYCVTHCKRHQRLIEDQKSLSGQDLDLPKWNRFCLGSLKNLLDTKRSVLSFPTGDEFFRVIWIVTKSTNIILR